MIVRDNLDDFLGRQEYRYGLAEQDDQVGVVTGLGLHVGWRRLAVHRSAAPAGQGPDEDHRQAGRCDEGID